MAGPEFPSWAASHRDVSAWRSQNYLEGLIDQKHERFALQFFIFADLFLFIYLLTPSLKGSSVRYAVFAANLAVQLWMIINVRTPYPTFGLIIGFFCGWNVLWSANLLIFNNARDKYKKIRRMPTKPVSYHWQPFPKDSFFARLGWAADLVFNSRGIGWDWKVSGTPSRPPAVESALTGVTFAEATKADFPRTSAGRVRYDTRGAAIRRNLRLLLQAYILLDVVKTIVSHDPYFWGLINSPAPAWLPEFVVKSSALTSLYRTWVAVLFVWQALELSFAIPHLLMLISTSPDTAGCNGEGWLYPDQFGSVKTIARRGLAGFWSGWWHQLFRNAFQSGSRAISKALKLKPKSPEAAGIELIMSFTLSGVLHAAASTTMLGPTQPWFKMYLFFALQPIGILTEVIWAHYFGRSSIGRKTPKWLAYTSHTTFAYLWLYLTIPLLAYELVTGGIFLYEPVPFSIFRGLGYGAPGDTLYCWRDLKLSWYNDSSRPWMSGIIV